MTRPMDALLLNATSEGVVKWRFLREVLSDFADSPQFGHTNIVGEPVFCHWKDKCFRLYEFRFKYWTDEDRYEWTHGVALELVTEPGGRLLADLPVDEERWTLLNEARSQAAGVPDIARELADELSGETQAKPARSAPRKR